MLATPVSRPLSRLPLLMALPFLAVLGALAMRSSDVDPIWDVPQMPGPAASCVMLLSDIGPPPADPMAEGGSCHGNAP